MVFYQACLFKKWLWALSSELLPNNQTSEIPDKSQYIYIIFNFECEITWLPAGHSKIFGFRSLPLDSGRKLNLTFIRHPVHLRNVLCAFTLRPVSRR